MNLHELTARFDERLAEQQKHYRKWQRYKKTGKRTRAAYQRRKFESARKAVTKLARLIRATKKASNGKASGEGAWSGSASVAQEIENFVEARRGECSGSEKRTETYGNPGSDHHVSQTDAYAIDFLLVNDYEMAAAIADHFDADWSGDYDDFIVVRGGNKFRIQIIAGTHGTGPHLHVGIRRVW
jgi:hypothetical protein